MRKWISVEEGLPDNTRDVWIWPHAGKAHYRVDTGTGHYMVSWHTWWSGYVVTHWAEIDWPETPEETNEKLMKDDNHLTFAELSTSTFAELLTLDRIRGLLNDIRDKEDNFLSAENFQDMDLYLDILGNEIFVMQTIIWAEMEKKTMESKEGNVYPKWNEELDIYYLENQEER